MADDVISIWPSTAPCSFNDFLNERSSFPLGKNLELNGKPAGYFPVAVPDYS